MPPVPLSAATEQGRRAAAGLERRAALTMPRIHEGMHSATRDLLLAVKEARALVDASWEPRSRAGAAAIPPASLTPPRGGGTLMMAPAPHPIAQLVPNVAPRPMARVPAPVAKPTLLPPAPVVSRRPIGRRPVQPLLGG